MPDRPTKVAIEAWRPQSFGRRFLPDPKEGGAAGAALYHAFLRNDPGRAGPGTLIIAGKILVGKYESAKRWQAARGQPRLHGDRRRNRRHARTRHAGIAPGDMATVRRLQARNNVPAKICVVEDDAAVRHAMANLLEAAGFEPIGFDAGEALLAWPHVADIDVALFGVRLRGMNGFALQACVQKLEPGIPLLLISGCSDIGMEQRAVQAGALALLRKPFDPAVLLQHIRRALSVGRGRPA